MPRPVRQIALLLFGSGMSALIYQVAWLREFRLVFGASTAASAAVLAIFIGGLGLGGLLLGPRADRHPSPLAFYARLETAVALAAATTPLLLWITRQTYVAVGGTATLGIALGTVVRLVLATLVLAVPTVLMGGTLPAAARAAESPEDAPRRGVALLYGVNTLGAVTGSFLATFFMLEAFGTRRTLWLACLVNLLVATAARSLAHRLAAQAPAEPEAEAEAAALRPAPLRFVLAAAALVGFAFFLMELVWYRMLGPLLGGSVFTFGLILSVALLGIGLGGAFYALLGRERGASLAGFAWTCLLEAATMLYPFALGDRVALLALFLRPLGALGFWGHVLGWTGVTAAVALPASIVAGYQFPMLIALLGRGRRDVGREIGLTYAWNTVGAIVGSLAGGFGLLPALTAPGCWRGVGLLLTGLGVAALVVSLRGSAERARAIGPALLAVAVVALLATPGPSAVWRHSGIGAGRATLSLMAPPNLIRDWLHHERRAVRWEADGVESSVALDTRALGLTFIVNGKVDGHATLDAPTQVMSGLLGTILHPHPRHALVIGLGTGSTAGWLGVVPGIERVDVVELEAAILEVARACAPVNQNVLANPKVEITIGDGREVLLTTKRRYDLIFSEPSNPYRAGIASLFTREYYEAAAARLEENGLFIQWMQAYEVDAPTVRRILATVRSVFPAVETWRTDQRNVLLLATRRPITYPVDALRQRIAAEPYRQALLRAWHASDLEGFLAHFVARTSLVDAVAAQEGPEAVNTDDWNRVEFGFAAAVGRHGLFSMDELINVARLRGEDRPAVSDGDVDWTRVEDERLAIESGIGAEGRLDLTEAQRLRGSALTDYLNGDATEALATWRRQDREPVSLRELELMAEALAGTGDAKALTYIERLRALSPAEADAILARLRVRQGRLADGAEALEAAFVRHRSDPWPATVVMQHAFELALEISRRDRGAAFKLLRALEPPFAALALHEERQRTALDIAWPLAAPACVQALAPFEPHVPWEERTLWLRLQCYVVARSPMAPAAAADLEAYRRGEPIAFAQRLLPSAQP
jgi:spermidine synthase